MKTRRITVGFVNPTELLIACKKALDALNAANQVLGGWEHEHDKKIPEYYKKERNLLRRVIAKAEGRKK